MTVVQFPACKLRSVVSRASNCERPVAPRSSGGTYIFEIGATCQRQVRIDIWGPNFYCAPASQISSSRTDSQIAAGRFRGLSTDPSFFFSIATSSQTFNRMPVMRL